MVTALIAAIRATEERDNANYGSKEGSNSKSGKKDLRITTIAIILHKEVTIERADGFTCMDTETNRLYL